MGKPKRPIRLIIALMLLVVILPAVVLGWRDLWKTFLETRPPAVQVLEFPRGLGASAKKYAFQLNDSGAGLAGVVVRLIQRGRAMEVFRQNFSRAESAKIEFELSADQFKLTEGLAELEFMAFDASFWNNTEALEYSIKVDLRKPFVQVLSTQHNIRIGGSQLVVYEAIDDNLTLHGVRVGQHSYLGVPLSGLDSAFTGSNVYGAFFTVTPDDSENLSIKVFAEDMVGNGASASFYHKVLPASTRVEKFKISTSYLHSVVAPFYKSNFATMQDWANRNAYPLPDQLTNETDLAITQALVNIHKLLLPWSEVEIKKFFKSPRSERLWTEAFQQPFGVIQSQYGKQIVFDTNGQELFDRFQDGFEIRGNRDVNAANAGIVVFSDSIGSFGKVIGIDHGAGLFSVYAWLKSSQVSLGESVTQGQVVGVAGSSGLSRGLDYFYQLRLYDTPVNPAEWWDKSWYLGHIVEKINDVKKKLGLQVYVGRLGAH